MRLLRQLLRIAALCLCGTELFPGEVADAQDNATPVRSSLYPSGASSYAPFAWGLNGNGQVGDGTTTLRAAPVPFGTVQDALDVGTGATHNVALKTDGTVWSSGSNSVGQLGDGTSIERHVPVRVQSLPFAVAVSAGTYYSLALAADQTVWEWGRAHGVGGARPNPARVSSIDQVTQVSGGGDHVLALRTDGTVWAWGEGSHGQLGNGTFGFAAAPVQVSNLQEIVSVSAGGAHGLALKSNGTVWAWGYDFYGQLGNGAPSSDSSVPIQVPGLTEVVAVAAGNLHSLAVKSDGTVWAWGSNVSGQLGDGSALDRDVPQLVRQLPPMVTIASGSISDSSFAVAYDGVLFGWGGNGAAQLGDGTTVERHFPVLINGVSNVRKIAAGFHQGIAATGPTGTAALRIIDAVSRKMHGGQGPFDIRLPLTGSPGVECRNTNGLHTLVFYFRNNLATGSATLASGTGVVGSAIISGNKLSVELSGVTDVQTISVLLSSVTDTFAQVLPDTLVSMNILTGDTTGDGLVTASDIGQVKSQSGLPVYGNFRTDIDANGAVNATDISQTKANSGHTLQRNEQIVR